MLLSAVPYSLDFPPRGKLPFCFFKKETTPQPKEKVKGVNDDTRMESYSNAVSFSFLFFTFYFQTRRVFILFFLRRERENDKVNTPSKMSVRSFRRSRRRGEKTLPKRKSPVVVVVVARLESIEQQLLSSMSTRSDEKGQKEFRTARANKNTERMRAQVVVVVVVVAYRGAKRRINDPPLTSL